jgi:hypothetical protein
MINKPVLRQPDFTKPFFLLTCKAPEGLSVRLEWFQVMAIVRGAAQGASSRSAIVPREPECVQWSP